MIRIVSIIVATLLFCYIVFVSFFFRESRQKELCRDLQVVVVDSLDKHFVSESDLVHILKKADLNPIKRPMDEINTDRIENELLKNEMIARVEAYKTPSGMIKLEVEQKIPILRVISPRGNYYVDNLGSTMPVSRRYVAHVPVVSGYVEKELAVTDLYKFALFLQENDFWNNQIEHCRHYGWNVCRHPCSLPRYAHMGRGKRSRRCRGSAWAAPCRTGGSRPCRRAPPR